MKKLKILFIGTVDEGGARRMVPLLKHVHSKGHEIVSVIVSGSEGAKAKFAEFSNSTIILSKKQGVLKGGAGGKLSGYLVEPARVMFAVRGALKDYDADLVYAFNPDMSSGGAGLICSKLFKKPMVLEFSDLVAEWGNHVNRGKKKNRVVAHIDSWVQNRVARGSSRIIATPFIRKYCMGLGIDAGKIEVIHCGADADVFSKKPRGAEIEAIRKEYGLGKSKIVLYTGALYVAFGMLDLIDAIAIVAKKHEDVKLVLVGYPNEHDMSQIRQKILERGVGKNVVIVGPRPHAEMPLWINAADICVNPFQKNMICRAGSPIKVFEYMACEKPVVQSNMESVEGIITDHENGLLYKPGDAEGLAGKIDTLLESQKLCERLGKNARKTIMGRYTWDKLGDRLVEAFYKTIDNSKKQGTPEKITEDGW